MTPYPQLHDLCLLANGLIQARATIYSTQLSAASKLEIVSLVTTHSKIDPEQIATDALAIYNALAAKTKPQSSSSDAL